LPADLRQLGVLQTVQTAFGAHPPFCLTGYRYKRQGRETDNLLQFSTEFKNQCISIFTLPYMFLACRGTNLIRDFRS